MQIVRTLVWVVLLVALVAFSVANWGETTEVHIWENLIWQTRLPAVVIVSFLLGLVPTWLVYRTQSWRMERRIRSLEGSHEASATTATSSTSATPTPATIPAQPKTPASPPTRPPASAAREDAGPLTSDPKR